MYIYIKFERDGMGGITLLKTNYFPNYPVEFVICKC